MELKATTGSFIINTLTMEKKEGYTQYSGEYKGPKGEKGIHLAEKQGKEIETYKKGTMLSRCS